MSPRAIATPGYAGRRSVGLNSERQSSTSRVMASAISSHGHPPAFEECFVARLIRVGDGAYYDAFSGSSPTPIR